MESTAKLFKKLYLMGIPVIDEQHAKLFDLFDEMEALREETSAPKERVWSVIQQFQAYAHYHFSTEEELLQRASYPDLGKQEEEHLRFRKQIGDSVLDLHIDNPLLLENLLLFTKKWLLAHICKEDKRYQQWVLDYIHREEQPNTEVNPEVIASPE